MRRIDITAELPVVVEPPAQFVAFALFPVMVPIGRQFVAVSPLYVDDFSEQSLLCHAERVELNKVVAAVLEHETVQPLPFRQVDEFPDVVHTHGRRHLNRHVLPVLQCAFRYGEMVQPVGSDIDEVDVLALAKLLVAVFAAVDVGGRHARLPEILLALFGTFALVVTECHDLRSRDMRETLHGIGTTHAQSHESHAHNGQLGGCQSERMLLSCLALRHFGLHDTILNAVAPRELCVDIQHDHRCHQKTDNESQNIVLLHGL